MIKLKAKSKNLEIELQINLSGVTREVFLNPSNVLKKRLEAVAVGLRSEVTMFLLDVEREIDFDSR